MPFTVSHVAAILPFSGGRLPLSALVVGAMAPDFEYMLRLRAHSEISHTPVGIIVFCIPAGLVALWLFHRHIKEAMTSLLPEALRSRLAPWLGKFPLFPLPRLILLAACIALGAATHIAWDACTHPDGWVVQKFPLLQQTIPLETRYGSPHIYRILQHGSTALGLLAVLFAIARWWRRTPARNIAPAALGQRQRIAVIAVLALATVLAGLTTITLQRGLPHDFMSLRIHLVLSAIAAMDASILLALAYAIARPRIEAALAPKFQ